MMNQFKNIFLYSILFIGLLNNLYAQQTAKRTDSDKGNMGYLEHLPADYTSNPTKTYPVLIFLHGLGERGDGTSSDLQKVKRHGPPKQIENGHSMCFTINGQQECFIVISPQLPTNNSTWGPPKVHNVVNHILNGSDHYRIDPNRIYLTGLSLGGIGTYNYASSNNNNNNTLAAIAPVAAKGTPSQACNISAREIPVWHFHGDQDNVVSYNQGLNMFNFIQNCTSPTPTAELIFTTYAGVGHNSWSRSYRTDNSLHSPNLYEWFLSKSLNASILPVAPSSLSGVSNLNTAIDLTWIDNSNNEMNFELERQSSNSGFSLIATIPANTTTYTDINLMTGTTYEYRIRAVNSQGNSSYSNVLSITTQNTPPIGVAEGVIWTDKVGVSEDANGNLTSTARYGWGNSGAASLQVIPANSDGWAEMTILDGPSANSKIFGLSTTNANADRDQIQFGIEIYGDNFAAFENGQRVRYFGKYVLGDLVRIERTGTDIQYFVNGVLRRTTTAPTSNLLVDVAINHNNTSIFDAKIFVPSSDPPPNSSNSVIWTDKVGVSEDANGNLTSTAGYGWGNSGAASLQVIPANSDGWAEMTILDGPSANSKVFGLSTTNANADRDQIQFGIEIYGDNFAAFENGQRVRYFGKYALGDVVRIERVGTDIQYFVNGVLRRTTTASTSSLLVDVAINHNSTSIFDAKIHTGIAPTFARIYASNNSIQSLKERQKQILLFPNPASQQITIHNIPKKTQRIEIYNVLGNRIFQQIELTPSITIDISSFENGWYSVYFVGSKQYQNFIKAK